IRFRLPSTGLQLELYGAMQPGSTTWRPTVAKIARLGHCVVRTPRKAPMVAELVEQLNFRVSDAFGDAVTFLRCFPNPYHHSFGVGRGDGDRFHHVNF